MKRSKNMMRKLAALAVVVGATTLATSAMAQPLVVSNVLDNVITAGNGIPRFLTFMGYLIGSAFSLAGIMKLKQHVDNAGQVPMKDGLVRLAAGGAFFCLPIVTQAMQGSVANGNSTAANTTAMRIENTSSFLTP